MGKQRRRKNSNRKGGPQKTKRNPNSASENDSNSNASGSSPLINKIRHGDVRVRHGALSALSSTVFSPESLHKSKVIKMELVQAVAERIMDDDVPCSLCAAGCIANYILFQETTEMNANSNKGVDNLQSTLFDANKVETILTPILLTKMNKVCDEIKATHDQMVKTAVKDLTKDGNSSKNNAKKVSFNDKKDGECPSEISSSTFKKLDQQSRKIMDQFSLLSLTLHSLCGLVEIFTTNNTSSSLLYHESDKFLTTTMKALIISNELILSITNAASINTTKLSDTNQKSTIIVNKVVAKKENESAIISDVSVYASRTIHSSSDDNPEFIKKILSTKDYWDTISSSTANMALPTMCRLHMAGIIVASRQIIVDENKLSEFDIDVNITSQIFPLLSQCTMYSTDIAQALCQQIVLVESKLKKEQDDEKLENNIIKTVALKKESARLIARRQKELKAAAKTNNDKAMKEVDKKTADNDVDMNSKSEETEDKYDKAVTAWRNACLPLKMAVEVIANLCSSDQGDDDEDFDENMEEYWDYDNEKELLSAQHEMKKHSAETLDLFAKVTTFGIPDRVLSMFGCLLLSILGPQKDQLPKVALDDILEVLAKCSICLGNVICNLDGWKSNDAELQAVWKEFFQCLRSSVNGEVNAANMLLPCQAIAALFNVMVPFLKFRSSLIKFVDDSDLELILAHLLMDTPKDMNQQDLEAVTDIQKDAIVMLGLLCSEPHPDVINERICTTFMAILNKYHSLSAAVISEILNVLMDMYSADEGDPNNHENVFRRHNVLDAFEKCIPILRRKIREESKSNPVDAQMWKETALNASRFVKYKKDS